MLTKKDLETKQKTFVWDNEGYWIDPPLWEAVIRNVNGKMVLILHCEVAGELEPICDCIEDIEHLAFLYEFLTGEELKIVK
jgi:hypothetical protein